MRTLAPTLRLLVCVFTFPSLIVIVEAFLAPSFTFSTAAEATKQHRRQQATKTTTTTTSTTHSINPTSASSFTLLSSSIGDACGLSYNEPLYRPPGEWRSLILQVTEGCSWNHCTFCEMYQSKTFHMKKLDTIEQELKQIVKVGGGPYVRDVFLADGDAMTIPTNQLLSILQLINQYLPKVRRISSYCLPRNIKYKTVDDLRLLKENKLSLVYIGCESGSDIVLQAVSKGETYSSSLDALNKLKEAKIKRSVMILLGLGGKILSKEHAIESAKLVTTSQPEYLSVLTTSFPKGKQRVVDGYQNNLQDLYDNNIYSNTTNHNSSHHNKSLSFEQLTSPREVLEELECFLGNVNIPETNGKTIFRSDHASNYFVLKGRLGRDKQRMLNELRSVLLKLLSFEEGDENHGDDEISKYIRPEWSRGL